MVFSTNQNRQFYVVKDYKNNPSAIGDAYVGKDKSNNFFIQHYGAGGLTRTDLIDPATVEYTKITTPEQLLHKMKYVDLTLDNTVNSGVPIAGQDYILRIVIHSYVGMSDLEPYFKFGAVHAVSGMTASTFYKKMALSLAKNFARELAPMLKFELKTATDPVEVTAKTTEASLNDTYTGIRITEVEQEWRRGIKEQVFVRFDVIPLTVEVDGEELTWGTTTEGESNTAIIKNGKKIADLEYFCMGERADQYRQIGWPLNLETEYLVDPSKEYYVLDIHFAFVGEGTHVLKSEKDITIVVEKALKAKLTALANGINAIKANLIDTTPLT